MNSLKPCPFCGSYDRHICQIPSYYKINPHIWYVKCDTCEAQGARHVTEAKAIAAWNSRAERTCFADEVTHRGCKYSVNRGWRERTCKIFRVSNTRDIRECSACGKHIYLDNAYNRSHLNYCPNCGAKVVQ